VAWAGAWSRERAGEPLSPESLTPVVLAVGKRSASPVQSEGERGSCPDGRTDGLTVTARGREKKVTKEGGFILYKKRKRC
jgi:hypothetical protein